MFEDYCLYFIFFCPCVLIYYLNNRQDFPRTWIWVTSPVSEKIQELLIIREHKSTRVRVSDSFMCCDCLVVLCLVSTIVDVPGLSTFDPVLSHFYFERKWNLKSGLTSFPIIFVDYFSTWIIPCLPDFNLIVYQYNSMSINLIQIFNPRGYHLAVINVSALTSYRSWII